MSLNILKEAEPKEEEKLADKTTSGESEWVWEKQVNRSPYSLIPGTVYLHGNWIVGRFNRTFYICNNEKAKIELTGIGKLEAAKKACELLDPLMPKRYR
jgi:hypothetical protein